MAQMSTRGVKFLLREEGMRPNAYQDPVGLLTIGIGHLLTRDELSSGNILIDSIGVNWRDGLSPNQIERLLEHDLLDIDPGIAVVHNLTAQNQIDAVWSLIFNIGAGAFRRSKGIRPLLAESAEPRPALEQAWLSWKFSSGQPILLERRKREWRLYSEGVYNA